MKPLRLKMQAFGPYARSAEVDFRVVSSGGLFLIHGQTGAGKTSILDGLCFSLFGKASGAERSPEGLRCDLSTPDNPTEVSLEFALGRDVYRIIRRPKQTVRKQRGEGVKTDQPQGSLWKLENADSTAITDPSFDFDSASWVPNANGDRKTDEQISTLLGMTEEQFRQVVVLPQGQFRKFLQASSDAREDLLEKLFRSSRFRELADTLDLQSKSLANEITQSRQGLAAHLASFEVATLQELQDKISTSTVRLKELEAGTVSLDQRHKEASLRRDRSLAAKKVLTDLSTTKARKEALQSKRAEYEDALQRLEKDRHARPVMTVDTRVIQFENDAKRLERDLATERERLITRKANLLEHRQTSDALVKRQPEIENKKNEILALRSLFVSAKSLKEAREVEQKSAQTVASLVQAFTQAEVRRNKALEDRETGEREAIRLEADASRLSALIAEQSLLAKNLTEAKETAQLKTSFDRHTIDLEKANALAFEKTKEKDAAQSNLKKAQIAFHLGQASRLAEELQDDSPCPVCGSLDHPKPAAKVTSLPSADDLETLEHALQAKTEAQSKQSLVVTKLETDLARTRQLLESRTSAGEIESDLSAKVSELESALSEKKKEIERTGIASEKAKSLRLAAVKLEADFKSAEVSLAQASRLRDEAQADLIQTKSRVQTLEESVPQESRDLDSITERGQRLNKDVTDFQASLQDINRLLETALLNESASRAAIETMEREITSKTSERDAAVKERSELLAQSEFSSLEECRAAGLDPLKSQTLERLRREFEQETHAVDTRLAELGMETAAIPEWALDIELRQSEFTAVDTERSERKAERLELNRLISTLTGSSEKLNETAKSIGALEARHSIVGRLAEVAAGRPPNQTRVNFQRYVLASQLDEVLVRASARLYEMSRGQFTLKRSRQVDDKRKNAGLDLEVEDAFTGTTRPTASLSGGEGFLASLALALGLADVVQSHLGGVHLDAIFVDEGFGTLDPESLDEAMKILAGLRSGGRLVGIISHVPELKDQIAHRLFVKKTPEGSHINWEAGV